MSTQIKWFTTGCSSITSRSNALLSSRNTCTQVRMHTHTHTKSLNKIKLTSSLQPAVCKLAILIVELQQWIQLWIPFPGLHLELWFGSLLFLVQLKSSFSITWPSSSSVLAQSKEGQTNTRQPKKSTWPGQITEINSERPQQHASSLTSPTEVFPTQNSLDEP